MPTTFAIGRLYGAKAEAGPQTFLGTVFAISDWHALTAYHCVHRIIDSPNTRLSAAFYDGAPIGAVLRSKDEQLDFAILTLESRVPPELQKVRLSSIAIKPGSFFRALGFPVSLGSRIAPSAVSGLVTFPETLFGNAPGIQLSCNEAAAQSPLSLPGLSGAPILFSIDDAEEVVGFVRWNPITPDQPNIAQGGIVIGTPITRVIEKDQTVREAYDEYARSSVAPSPSVFTLTRRPNAFFTGREAEIAALRGALETRRQVAVSGEPGVGKSQLVAEYAYKYKRSYRYVLWIDCGTSHSLIRSIRDFADDIDLSLSDLENVTSVGNRLARWLSKKRDWLVVFDNVNDFALVTECLPFEPVGHVLATTRLNAAEQTGAMEHVALKPLPTATSANFLLTRIGLPAPSEAEVGGARALVELLWNLPLAIEIAAAFIIANGTTIVRYREAFERQRFLMLELAPNGLGVSLSFGATWLTTLHSLRAKPASVRFLEVCAYLYPERIPDYFAASVQAYGEPTDSPDVDPGLRADIVLAPLVRYALITRERQAGSVSIHRLCQEIVRFSLPPSEAEARQAEAAALLKGHLVPVAFENWPKWESLSLHVGRLWKHLKGQKTRFVDVFELLVSTAQFFNSQGQSKDAIPLLHDVIGILDLTSPDEQLLMAKCKLQLAIAFRFQKFPDYEQTKKACSAAVEAQIQYQAPIIDRMESLTNAGYVAEFGDEPEAAAEYAKQALQLLDQQPNSDQLRLLAYGLAGTVARRLGEVDRAAEFLGRASDLAETIYGCDHPDTATAWMARARLFYQTRNYDKAQRLVELSLAIRRRTLQKLHPSIAVSGRELAKILIAKKRFEEARLALLEVLEIEYEAGNDLGSYLEADLRRLGKVYALLHDNEKAQAYYVQARGIHKTRKAANLVRQEASRSALDGLSE